MIKSPEYLFAYDYDKTAAQTFEVIPGFYDVPQAVNLATGDVFGKRGLAALHRQGGLLNRASSELVNDLLNDPMVETEKLVSSARSFIDKNIDRLEGMMPIGKGVKIKGGQIVEPSEIAEAWTRQKLSYMLEQIGQPLPDGDIWPRLTAGFKKHWELIDHLKENNIKIDRAIVSSGHEYFIRKSFEVHKLTQPEVVVSEDDIRGNEQLKNKSVVKPSIFSLGLAVRRWQGLGGFPGEDLDKALIKEFSEMMIYFGDDKVKDGQMADSADVFWGNFDQTLPSDGIMAAGELKFNNWMVADCLMLANSSALMNGESTRKVFAHA